MSDNTSLSAIDRRGFLKVSAVAAAATAGAGALTKKASASESELDYRNHRPDRMSYKTLGRTNFVCSRLVFGCGAALAGGKAVRLLEQAYEAGINHFDVGYDDYYKGSEKFLADFLNAHRDDLWVTSKAPARNAIGMGQLPEYTVDSAKADAAYWTGELDKSLVNLKVEYVDAYYLMMAGVPAAMKSEELHNAFLTAKAAGKMGHWGISTHLRAQECLEAATETGWYDLAMIAITPGGWYDPMLSKIDSSMGTMKDIKPVLERAKAAGIGLVGMKAARHIATNPYDGISPMFKATGAEPSVYDEFYPAALLEAPFSGFQRSYAYVLNAGMDVVNADMQNFKHFEENVIAARTAENYLA